MAGLDEGMAAFEVQLAELETSMAQAASMTAAFQAELRGMQDTMLYTGREVEGMSRSIGGGLRRAFDGVVFDGMRLSDALRTVARSMVDAAYNTAMRPVQNALGSVLANGINGLVSSILPFQKGGAISQGRVMPFARGGVVQGATSFPMRGGMGLMGEAGPEAIMPLRRGADGRLGVAAAGGGAPVQVVMNITTPDVQGFARSQTQIAAQMGRALARGQRNR
ncbi:phage tail tape measure protein [Roseicyclus mahoneyensis]|uniref:Lambda family phage tail tape measure protein n=1 Tax=Roseicyclus mahoneyensis TaxID=164332 RepID=A0A316GMM0_9RHOB|nr:phage tail tape measure protein [Roseicyclus mahoneyensis]PWK62164.1 lambda family phage tail tape measure protein [Roseicyclus mahoneyensis]